MEPVQPWKMTFGRLVGDPSHSQAHSGWGSVRKCREVDRATCFMFARHISRVETWKSINFTPNTTNSRAKHRFDCIELIGSLADDLVAKIIGAMSDGCVMYASFKRRIPIHYAASFTAADEQLKLSYRAKDNWQNRVRSSNAQFARNGRPKRSSRQRTPSCYWRDVLKKKKIRLIKVADSLFEWYRCRTLARFFFWITFLIINLCCFQRWFRWMIG